MAASGEMFTLDGKTHGDVQSIANLHEEHLGDSPIVLFGDRFLREFYYTLLVRDGLIGAMGCRVDGKVVGFISYTIQPLGFMTTAIKRYPIRLSWIMLRTVFAKPSVLGQILKVLRMMLDRGKEGEDTLPADRGEVISLVAEPQYQKLVPEGGKERLTARFFREAIDYFKANGCSSVHLMVKPDNRASNLFCSVMGCRFEKILEAGAEWHRYVYEIPD